MPLEDSALNPSQEAPQEDTTLTSTETAAAQPVSEAPAVIEPSISQTPVAAAEPVAEWKGVREYLPDLGIPADKFTDDEQALRFLAERAQQYYQVQPYQQYLPHAQHLAQNWDKYQAFLQSQATQQAQPQPAPAKEPEKPYWEPLPEFNQDWLRYLERDPETQALVIKDKFRGVVQPDLPQKVEAFLRAKQDRETKLYTDPVAAIRPGLESVFAEREKKLHEQFEQKLTEKLNALRADWEARQYLQANYDKLVTVDPLTRQEVVSPQGQALLQYMNAFEQAGVKDVYQRRQMAEAFIAQQQQLSQLQYQLAQLQGNPQAAAQQAQAANEQHKRAFTNGNNNGNVRRPSRAGTVAAALDPLNPPQNTSHDIGAMLTHAFEEAGNPA